MTRAAVINLFRGIAKAKTLAAEKEAIKTARQTQIASAKTRADYCGR